MPARRGGITAEAVEKPPLQPEKPTEAARITVALIPKAADDLQRLQDRTTLSKTDLTNRAITLYEFIDAQLREGREVLIRDPATKEIQLVHLFV